jgi:hypothetical protein
MDAMMHLNSLVSNMFATVSALLFQYVEFRFSGMGNQFFGGSDVLLSFILWVRVCWTVNFGSCRCSTLGAPQTLLLRLSHYSVRTMSGSLASSLTCCKCASSAFASHVLCDQIFESSLGNG